MHGNRYLILVLFLLTVGFGCSREPSGMEGKTIEDVPIASALAAADMLEEGPAAGSTAIAADSAVVQGQASPERQKAPRIEFDEKQFDFGEIDAGEKVEHIFSFKNKGDAPLIVEKVKSS